MNLLSAWYAIAGIVCVFLLYFIEKGRKPVKRSRQIVAIVLWMLVLCSVWTTHGRQAKRFFSGQSFRIWSVYHYYLGAKYFDELGYHDLYIQTLAADKEGPNRLRNVKIIRDLYTLKKEPKNNFIIRRSSRFSDGRWNEFRRDVNYFTGLRSGRFYGEVLCDRGYNPTPFWTFAGSFLTNVFDIENSWHRMLLLSLDSILCLLTIAFCIWSFGASSTAVLFLIFILLPFNDKRMFGGLLTYDWFYTILLGLAFLNKKKGRLSALFWAYSVMSRVFPAVFVSGIFIVVCRDFWKTGSINNVYRRFITGFAIFCCAGIILGSINAYGPESWGTFRENISEHASQHISGARRVGIKKILTLDLVSSEQSSVKKNLENNMVVGFVLQAILFFGAVSVVLKKQKTDAMLWMLPVFFALAVSSRYYWSVLGCFALLEITDGNKRPSFKGSIFGMGVIACWYFYSRKVLDPHQRYIFMNILLFAGFILILAWELGRNLLQKKQKDSSNQSENSMDKYQGNGKDRRSVMAFSFSVVLLLLISIFVFLIPVTELRQDEFPDWIQGYSRNLKWKKRDAIKKLNQSILNESFNAGKRFMINNQKPAGNFNYEYDFVKRTMTEGDHQVRQAGALWGLALIYSYQRDPEVRDALEKDLRFFFEHTVEGAVDGTQVIAYPGAYVCHTGTVALTALAVIEYLRMEKQGDVKIDVDFKEEMVQRLNGYIEHLKYLRLEDGHFSSAIFLPVKIKYPKSSPYYDGETLLCLTKAAKYLGYNDLIPIIEKSAIRMARYYTAKEWQKDSDSEMTKGFFQWGCMSFWEYQDAGWENAQVMGDSLISLAWWMVHKHHILKRARNTAYAFEGIIHAYNLAKKRNNFKAVEDLGFVIDRGLYKLTSWQVAGPLQAKNTFLVKHNKYDRIAAGGVMNHSRAAPLRIDVAQHQMHSVILALKYIYF